MDIPRLLNELDNIECVDQPLLLEPAQIVQAHRYKLKKQEMADLKEILAKVILASNKRSKLKTM